MPGDEISGQWTGIEQLTETLSAILFLVTVQHAAVCNSQYDELGFPPNYSSLLNGVPPVELVSSSFHILVLMLLLVNRTLFMP